MFKSVVVLDTNGTQLAEFALAPFVNSEFSVEFGDGLQRLFVVRNAKTKQVIDSVVIGDCSIKIITKNF